MPRCDSGKAMDSFWRSLATHLAGSRDPLDRAAADSELLGNLVQTWAPRCSQRVPDAILKLGIDEGATAMLAVSLSPSNPRIHPLADHGSLELGEHAHHLK